MPIVAVGEEVSLRFMEYYTYSSSDRGEVQISEYDSVNETWSDWIVLKTVNQHTPVWHHVRVDLTAYAGKRVRIAFSHIDGTETSNGFNAHKESTGWYIDDVVIETTLHINQAPEITLITDQQVDEDGTLDVPVSAADPENDAITLSVSNLPSFGSFTDNGNGAGMFVFTPGLEDSGYYVIIVVASDGINQTSESFTLKVNITDQPPVITVIDDKEMDSGDSLNVYVSAEDPDLDAITLSATDLPPFAALTDNGDGTGIISINPTQNDDGNFLLTFNASGGGLISEPGSFNLVVNPVTPPFSVNFSADMTKIALGQTVKFTDLSDGTPVSWQWDFNNDGVLDSIDQNPSFTYYNEGTYTVTLTVSDGTDTHDHVKKNYIQALRPLPDLQVTHIEHSQAAVGQTIEVSWTVTNTGVGSTNVPGWYDRVWISPDPEVRSGQPEDVLLGKFENLTYLEPGGSYIQTKQLLLPANLTGTYYLFVVTDNTDAFSINLDTMEASSHGGNVVAELNDRNNFAFKDFNITIPPAPDLQVASVSPDPTAFSDGPININWTVENRGEVSTGNKQWADRVFISKESTFNGNAISIGSNSHTEDLIPDGSYSTSSTFTLPHAIYGNHYVYVTTDNNKNVNEYLFENNNTTRSEGVVDIILSPPPDLVASEIVIPDSSSSNEAVNIKWTVENQGPGITYETNWSDSIYLSDNATFDQQTAILLKTVSRSGKLEPGLSYTNESLVKVPDDITGDYFVFVKTDSRDQVFEHESEDNNTLGSPSTIQIITPDLEPVEVNVSPGGSSGEHLAVSWSVKNIGLGDRIGGNWKDTIYLSQDLAFNINSAIVLESHSQSGIVLSGSTYLSEPAVNLPEGISGDYYIFIFVDSDNSIFEDQGEDNNVIRSEAAIPVELSPWPDLQASIIDHPGSATAGDNLPVTWEVGNYGIADTKAGPWVDTIYLSTSSEWDGNFVSSVSLNQSGPLLPSQTYSKSFALKLPSGMTGGQYYLYAETDTENNVYEHTDEGNNMSPGSPVTIMPYPPVDLTVTSFNAVENASSGKSIDVNWAIRNIGEARTLASEWDDKLFLSLDNQLDINEDIPVMRVAQSGALNSLGEYTKNVSAIMPHGVSGNYNLIIMTDVDDGVSEDNEDNNTASTPVFVELTPPPDLEITSYNIPSEGTSGQPIPIEWTVQNNGTGPADTSEWYDAVYLSTDNVLDGDDIRLSTTIHKGILNPENSYNVSGEVDLPVYVSGIYFILIKTDSRNDIYEHNGEENNEVSQHITITIPPPSDLIVTSITVPESAVPGESVTISWTVENQGINQAVGRMREAVYISDNDTWEYTDPMLGTISRDISIEPGASLQMSMAVDFNETFTTDSTGNITATLPGVINGDHHIAVWTDIRNNIRESDITNNRLVSVDVVSVDVPTVEPDIPSEETIFGENQKKYYRIDVTEGLDLKLTLASDVPDAWNELYVAFDRVPSLTDSDFLGVVPFAANQETLIPSTQAGTYYIMVYARDLPDGVDSQNISLLAEAMSFSISGITPDAGGVGGRVTCTLTGAGFRDTTKVFLRISSEELLEGKVVEFINTMELRVRWDLSDVALGTYDIVAKNVDESIAESLDGFTVETSTGMQLHIGSQSADSFREGTRTPVSFYFTNTGNIDIPYLNVAILVPTYIEPISIQNTQGLLKNSDLYKNKPVVQVEDYTYAYSGFGWNANVEFNLIKFVAKDMSPGKLLQSNIVFEGVKSPEFPLIFFGDTLDVIEFIDQELNSIESLRQGIINNPGDYDDDFVILANKPETFRDSVLQPNYIENGLIDQDVLNDYFSTFNINKNVTSISSQGLGPPLTFKCWAGPMIEVACRTIYIYTCFGADPSYWYCAYTFKEFCDVYKKKCKKTEKAVDPNEIIGPDGYGDENWISKDKVLPYAVHFENDPELATLAAQNVTIRQSLDANLDPRTFRLGSIGFGDHLFTVPENRAYYSDRLDLVDSQGLYVDVTAGIDVTTNEVFWSFRSIDPDTGLPPTNPLAGFLPVGGQGYVTYTIKAKEETVTGDVINAQASIVFDVNEPVDTPPIFNTLDADYPESQVQNSGDSIDATTFLVSWAGQDVPGGSELEGFDIYVSDNDASYELWLSNTTETSAPYTGVSGHTYGFYSRARDNAGNIELPPEFPDVIFAIDSINNPPDVPSSPSPVLGAIDISTSTNLSWTGGDPDPTDTVTYDVYLDTVNSPLNKVADNQADTSYSVSGLAYSTTFYWKIVARDSQGAETEGPVWSFTTFSAEDDTDNDGLSNQEEILNGTNPLAADTDEDGMPDGYEVANGLNPLVDDSAGDINGNGITNLQEYLEGIFKQVNVDGFGDSNNSDDGFITFNEYLYAGTGNTTTGVEIWRSSDGTDWIQVNQDGFGDSNNNSISGRVIFQGYIYIATDNDITGIEVWRTSDGTNWGQVNPDGFGDSNNVEGELIVFNGYLYASVDNPATGTEVWRSSDGIDWTQVNQDGFDDSNNVAGGFIVFNGYLYVTNENPTTGTEVWRTLDGTDWGQVNQDGFDDLNNEQIDGVQIFGCYLYVATINNNTGTEVWRTLDGTDWGQVNQDGFGDLNNGSIDGVQIFGSYLYMATINSNTGTEIWKTHDGASWTMANSRGFGDAGNNSADFTIYGNYLYAITENDVTGTEVWRLMLPSFGSSYAGIREWESPDLGQVPEGEGVKVADVDGDGTPEVIAINGVGGGGAVHVFGNDGAGYQEEWTSGVLANALDDVKVEDVDNDGKLEIVVSTMEAGNIYIYVFGFDGSNYIEEWKSNLFPGDGYMGLSLDVVDADSDGLPEIVVSSDEGLGFSNSSYIWIYDYDGATYQQVWSSGLLSTVDVPGDLIMADIDNDGVQEMVFEVSGIYIIGYNGTNYQIEWQIGALGNEVGSAIGDVNADGVLELVVFLDGGANNIQIYRFDGQTYNMEWQSCEIAPSGGEIGDVDGDGIKEIVVGSWSGEVYIYGYDGTTYQLEWQTATPSPYVDVEKIWDFNRDGKLEILVQERTDEDSSDDTYYCDVYGYDGGSYKLQWRDLKINSYFGGLLDPAGDVDNDGIVEEVRFANNESVSYPFSIYVVGTKNAPVRITNITQDWGGSNDVEIEWASVPGAEYQISYKDDYNGTFSIVETVIASGDSTSWTDDGSQTGLHPSAVQQRYYKVIQNGVDSQNVVGIYRIGLNEEMNLISLPLVPFSTSLEDVIGTQISGGTNIAESDLLWVWNGTNYSFVWLMDGVHPSLDGWFSGNNPTTVQFGADQGAWLEVKPGHGPANIYFVGEVSGSNRSIPVVAGMNLVGTSFPYSVGLSETNLWASGFTGATGIGGSDLIWIWLGDRYEFIWLLDGVHPSVDGTWYMGNNPVERSLEPGRGYWIERKDGSPEFDWNYPGP
ncbi:MAG: FG-GAP-like repeat-containing protein [Candidatus Scalindua rubra]|nr:FG-GAP-like repeat-containing protein [Candidatus Scalindua rubra]